MKSADKVVSAVVVAVFIVAAYLNGLAETKVAVEIKFREFANPGGRDEGGSYCDGVSSSCETYFKLCVKLSRSITTSFSRCDYQPSSSRYIKSNNINFQTQNTNIDRTVLLRQNQWNGYVSFYMEVWDADTISDDKIDTFSYTDFYSPGINGSGVEQFHTIYGARSSHKTTLYFSVKVFCDLHYYGSNCSTFCKSRNDRDGHYRCNHTGERVCYQNWYNLPNCLKHCVSHNDDINSHYVCTSNGSRVCQQNWYNLPYCKTYCVPQNDTVNGRYECSNAGEKICRNGWHGDNCTIFCLPRIDEHYNCSETGARICHEYWYGPNCTRFCNSSSDTVDGFYNCSSSGLKLCRKDYFGENCTVFCKEAQNHSKRYICDKTTGAKLCLDNWTGLFCNVSKVISLLTQGTQSLTSFSLLTSRFTVVASTSSEEVFSTPEVVTMGSSTKSNRISSTVDIWPLGDSTLLAGTPSLATALTWLLQSTNTLSPQHSASYTSTHSIIPHTSLTSSFQATSTAAQSSEKEAKMLTTTVSTTPTTITRGLVPSKSPSVYNKLSSTVTQGMSTPKPDVVPKKEKSGNESKNVTWIVDTKEGRTVLIGAIFAFLLLLGATILIVMYVRLPKRDTTKNFESLEETPEEWTTDEQLAKSYMNPLYLSPDESIHCRSHQKQSKLEKFYTKKDPSMEPKDDACVMGVSGTSYYDNDDERECKKSQEGIKNAVAP